MPFYMKQCRYPYAHKENLKRKISQTLESGIISPGFYFDKVQFASYQKKLQASGKKNWRMVIDYRKLNEQTLPDKYVIPNI